MTIEYRRPFVPAIRATILVTMVVVVIAYTAGVVIGKIPKTDRIDWVNFAIILMTLVVVVLSMNPSIIERVRTVEMKGFKIELLEIREQQLHQNDQLRDVRLLIPLLVPDAERKHLSNLARGITKSYRSSGSLRDELRRLRSIGLIRMRNNHAVADIRSETPVDLAEYVELTYLGQRWAQRLADLEIATTEPPANNDSLSPKS